VTWVLVIVGFSALIILHEFGHFIVAKATGMRVERFFLFFPPKLVSFRSAGDRVRDRHDPARGLREDHRDEPGGAGAADDPGGTGGLEAGRDTTSRACWSASSPPARARAEPLPPDVLRRAYYNQPVWKRVAVIAAGPGDEHPDRLRDPLLPRLQRRADHGPGSEDR
jgi:regulator of sigma E protease